MKFIEYLLYFLCPIFVFGLFDDDVVVMDLRNRVKGIDKVLLMSEVKDIEMVLKKKFSGKEVIRAGERLIDDSISSDSKEFSKVMDVLSYWRFTHEMPLEKALEMVQSYAKSQDKNSICAKRLKRHVSIANKLRRFEGMKLKNMQDIGGCRAILSSVKKLRQVERELKKKPEFRIRIIKILDYIK